MSVFSFRQTIVLRGMGWGCKVRYAIGGEVRSQGYILPSIICIEVLDFCFESGFNQRFELKKYGFDIRLGRKRK